MLVKKILSILLAALLIAAILPMAAFADGPAIVLSNQGLRVNGIRVDCERYNIDGNNYFQLRDLAYVLNGTGSQFSVGYDSAAKSVSLTTGEGYASLGTEMQMSDFDKIDTAAPSNDKLVINGEDRSDLSAYKIGGHNYYKLAELGPALGFQVSYDTPSRTMIVITKAYSYPTKWLTEEYIYNDNGAAVSHEVRTYDEDGRLISSVYEGIGGSDKETHTYDEFGREATTTYESTYNDGETENYYVNTYTYDYDMWGQRSRIVCQGTGDVVYETVYTYDDDGNMLMSETTDNSGRSGYYYTYDENGNLIKSTFAYEDEVMYATEYVLDADGNVVLTRELDGEGNVSSSQESKYTDGRVSQSTYTSGDYTSFTNYTYDERGNLIRYETQDNYGTYVANTIYNEKDLRVQEEYSSDTMSYVAVYEYNELGLQTRSETTYSDGTYFLSETVYDEAGNILKAVNSSEGYSTTATYTYDEAAGKLTVLYVSETFGVG
jgi:hypothetical protein